MKLPFKINSYSAKESEDSTAIQFSDIIAGCAFHFTRAIIFLKEKDDLFNVIEKSKFSKLLFENFSIWPHQFYVDPDSKGGVNVLDGLTKILENRIEKEKTKKTLEKKSSAS